MADFGSTFKNARLAKGLTLEQIAEKTKIGTRFLDAIEKEEFQRLPGGIFSRGFVKAYAECIGLNAQDTVTQFERLSGVGEPAMTAESERVNTPAPAGFNRKLFPLAIVALIILFVIFYLAMRASTTSVTANPPVGSIPSRIASTPPVTSSTPAPEPQSSTIAAPTPETTPNSAPAPSAAIPEPSSPPAKATEPSKAPLTIVVEATATTWVKIRADGEAVNPGEVLQKGTTRQYTAQSSLDVMVGNAGGIAIKVNDREIRPLGKSGQVRSVTITPDNLKDLIS